MPPKLGILAGGGELPARLAALCRTSERPYFIVALEDQCDPSTVEGAPHRWLRIGAAGAILDALHGEGVADLIMVGRIKRPKLRDLRPDAGAVKILARIGRHMFGGDDELLRAVTRELETEGFRVRGVQELMDDLVAPYGALGDVSPDQNALRDILCGAEAARALGQRDAGQAAVVRDGEVIALEGPAGTDAMLRECAPRLAGRRGGVLVKMRKPNQDDRVDLPTIGPGTVRLAAEIGLAGIAVEAGQTLVVDRAETIRRADALGLFVVGTSGRG
jgi:DUF1009 family protein